MATGCLRKAGRSSARGLHDVYLNETGRDGERLTLEFEKRRTGRSPRWIALDSNLDGYDVLSSVGPKDASALCIEVKASRSSAGEFYLTRHEWDMAQTFETYTIHLWELRANVRRLAVVDLAMMATQIPVDCGSGRWDCVRVPFSSFAPEFKIVEPNPG